jgi:hypothetical protein
MGHMKTHLLLTLNTSPNFEQSLQGIMSIPTHVFATFLQLLFQLSSMAHGKNDL